VVKFFYILFINEQQMAKAYQPIVIEETDNLIQGLIESEFFLDYDIIDYSFARQFILDELTQKYIDGLFDESEDAELFTEDEFTKLLQKIVAGSLLSELKERGLVSSYEDEDTEESFFLTEEGKQLIRKSDNQ
jgi:hypothetical protein